MTTDTLIIIPCFNEAKRLETQTFIDFARSTENISFLFVNDGSSDATESILNGLLNAQPDKIHVLHLPRNAGKAEAVRQGFIKGFSLHPTFIGYLDADLAAPLDCIAQLKNLLVRKQKDIVIGSRIALLGWNVERNNARHYAGRVFATAASMILGIRVYDTQCGAKLFRVSPRLKTIFGAPFTVKWIFDVEILARFLITETAGLPRLIDICIECPLEQWIDKKGSKLRLVDFLVSGMDLLKIVLIIWRKSLPRH
ncbi:MAG: glycosyltransferase [Candidatus Omnitrophica bacterium]|nr:glycosyltransferase [Candidatus Omnitrophota bacterium]